MAVQVVARQWASWPAPIPAHPVRARHPHVCGPSLCRTGSVCRLSKDHCQVKSRSALFLHFLILKLCTPSNCHRNSRGCPFKVPVGASVWIGTGSDLSHPPVPWPAATHQVHWPKLMWKMKMSINVPRSHCSCKSDFSVPEVSSPIKPLKQYHWSLLTFNAHKYFLKTCYT
jgi:hypothetical protein